MPGSWLELPGPGAPLTLNLFDDATFEAVVERVRPTRGAGYVVTARLPGTDRGEMMLAVNGRAVSGMVDTPQGSFTIRSDGFGRLTVREVDPSAVPELATPLSPEAEVPLSPATAEIPAVSLPQGMSTPSGPGQPGSSPLALTGPSADIGVDDGSPIDVLVVYTPAARQWLGGTAETENHIDLAFAYLNSALEDSGAVPRFRLVRTEAVSFDAAGSVHGALDALEDLGDGRMDGVEVLRNRYAADLVHLLCRTGRPGLWRCIFGRRTQCHRR